MKNIYILVNGLGMRQTQNDIDLKRNEFGTKLCMGETLRYRLIQHSHLSVYHYVFSVCDDFQQSGDQDHNLSS